jgi:hypothetical protein
VLPTRDQTSHWPQVYTPDIIDLYSSRVDDSMSKQRNHCFNERGSISTARVSDHLDKRRFRTICSSHEPESELKRVKGSGRGMAPREAEPRILLLAASAWPSLTPIMNF